MKRIVFMGTPDFAVPVLQTLLASPYEVVLVVTQPDRPVGRKRVLSPPPVKAEAEKHGIAVFQPEKIRTNYEEIIAAKPDVIVTAAYGQILPTELLEAPPFGSINVHASLLPKLRGGAPIHYALLQGEEKTGVTIMYMVDQLDAGDMIAKEEIVIKHTDNVATLHDALATVGSDLLKRTLPSLFAGEINPEKQNEEEATFAPNITRELERIDWTQDSLTVYNHIRGLCPWPVAYTTLSGQQVKIWEAHLISRFVDGKPGEIVEETDSDTVIVACGDQKGIELIEIQPAGSRKMQISDYRRGSSDRLQIGEQFDS